MKTCFRHHRGWLNSWRLYKSAHIYIWSFLINPWNPFVARLRSSCSGLGGIQKKRQDNVLMRREMNGTENGLLLLYIKNFYEINFPTLSRAAMGPHSCNIQATSSQSLAPPHQCLTSTSWNISLSYKKLTTTCFEQPWLKHQTFNLPKVTREHRLRFLGIYSFECFVKFNLVF